VSTQREYGGGVGACELEGQVLSWTDAIVVDFIELPKLVGG